MEKQRIKALATHLELDNEEKDDLIVSRYNDKLVEYGNEEYLVLTDEEADDALDDELDTVIDECVLVDLPESFHIYFDREKWKADANHEGRGHHLGRYDGVEHSVEAFGKTFYIYRQN